MKHKREQSRTDVNLIKWGIQRASHKTQELADAMKAADARTQRENRPRFWGFNKDEFKLLTEVIDIVIALLPMLTRLLKCAVLSNRRENTSHKLGD